MTFVYSPLYQGLFTALKSVCRVACTAPHCELSVVSTSKFRRIFASFWIKQLRVWDGKYTGNASLVHRKWAMDLQDLPLCQSRGHWHHVCNGNEIDCHQQMGCVCHAFRSSRVSMNNVRTCIPSFLDTSGQLSFALTPTEHPPKRSMHGLYVGEL